MLAILANILETLAVSKKVQMKSSKSMQINHHIRFEIAL